MKNIFYLIFLSFLGACNYSEQAQQASASRYNKSVKEASCFSDSAFYKELSIGDYSFQLSGSTQHNNNELHILASCKGVLLNDNHQFINEPIVNTLLCDLNNNQLPELLIVTQNNNGSSKKLWGFEINANDINAFNLSSISSRKVDYEQFSIENNQLVHTVNQGKEAKKEVYSLNLFHQLTLISAS